MFTHDARSISPTNIRDLMRVQCLTLDLRDQRLHKSASRKDDWMVYQKLGSMEGFVNKPTESQKRRAQELAKEFAREVTADRTIFDGTDELMTLGAYREGYLAALADAETLVAALKSECCCPGERNFTPPYEFVLCDPCETLKSWRGE